VLFWLRWGWSLDSISIQRLRPEDFEEYSKKQQLAYLGKPLQNLHSVATVELYSYDSVFGVYRGEELVGGYIVNHRPIRTWSVMSSEEQQRASHEAEHACEIVGVWRINERIRSKDFLYKVWTRAVQDALATGKSRIWGMSYKGHGMMKTYMSSKARILKNADATNELVVFSLSRLQFRLVLAWAFLWSFLKLFLPQKTKSSHEAA